MASAPLLRQHLLPLAGLTTALALYPKRSISAEEAQADPLKDIRARKPIYPDPSQPTIPTSHGISASTPYPASGDTSHPNDVEESTQQSAQRKTTPTDRLARQIQKSRLFLHTYVSRAEDGVNSAMDSVLHAETTFTNTIASLAPPKESNEKLLPGTIYVLVAAMAGTILSRNRNILLRFAVPVTTGVVAAHYVIPRTTENVGNLIWRFEEQYPVIRDNHLRIREGAITLVQRGKSSGKQGLEIVEEKVHGVRETVEEWVKKGR